MFLSIFKLSKIKSTAPYFNTHPSCTNNGLNNINIGSTKFKQNCTFNLVTFKPSNLGDKLTIIKQKQSVKTRIYIYIQQIIYPPVYYTQVVKINYWTEFKNFAYKFTTSVI